MEDTVTRLIIFIVSGNYSNYSPKIVLYKYDIIRHSIVVFGGRLEEFCKISGSKRCSFMHDVIIIAQRRLVR